METKKKLSLPVQIFIALVLGIVVGLVFYFIGIADFTTNYLKPFGDIFVNLLKFIMVPVVLLSMIDGIIYKSSDKPSLPCDRTPGVYQENGGKRQRLQ